jgi:hypothetical protein
MQCLSVCFVVTTNQIAFKQDFGTEIESSPILVFTLYWVDLYLEKNIRVLRE